MTGTATAAPAVTIERGTMPLAGHLREARRRGIRAAVALVAGVVAGIVLADQVLDLLRGPVEELAGIRDASLNYDTVTAAFDLRLRIALVTGLVLSSPVWLTEAFAFVTPGLTRRERRYALGFAAAAVPLFLAGCCFGFAIFPEMVVILTAFAGETDSTILSASAYVDFAMTLVVATGIAFVLPAFMVMLNVVGLVPARTLRRSWRLIVVVITLFSALVTPAADVLSMFLVAAPMSALFGAALVITHLHDARAARRSASPAT